MKQLWHHPTTQKIWRQVKPWVSAIALVVILRYTGALAGISFLTNTALLNTGALDADTEAAAAAKTFNYNFSVKTLEGNVVDFNAFKGKTIFLNVWATWCGPCRVEMPSIQQLYNKVNSDKIVFVMIAVDRSEDFSKVVKFVQDKAYTFPVYTPSGYLPDQLQVPSIPTTFVINGEGKIVSKETGATNYDTPKFKRFLEGL